MKKPFLLIIMLTLLCAVTACRPHPVDISSVVVITVDDSRTAATLGTWPFTAVIQATALSNLLAGNPAAAAYRLPTAFSPQWTDADIRTFRNALTEKVVLCALQVPAPVSNRQPAPDALTPYAINPVYTNIMYEVSPLLLPDPLLLDSPAHLAVEVIIDCRQTELYPSWVCYYPESPYRAYNNRASTDRFFLPSLPLAMALTGGISLTAEHCQPVSFVPRASAVSTWSFVDVYENTIPHEEISGTYCIIDHDPQERLTPTVYGAIPSVAVDALALVTLRAADAEKTEPE